MARALGIIPARYASSRFPGKPLASLSGKPLLQHVYERAARARLLAEVWVATDDPRIRDLTVRFGGKAVMTSPDHPSGSDRVAEAAALPEARGAEVVVNIQGDQPLLDPDALDGLVAAFDGDPGLDVATLFEPLRTTEDLLDPNVAKVVSDRQGNALYFSRSPIPYYRAEGAAMVEMGAGGAALLSRRRGGMAGYWKHVGVYAFRAPFLFEFGRLERGPLEELEGLEQLRVLEAGRRIRLVPSAGASISVETPEDLRRVEAIIGSGATS
ncbi:MAG TPA: 3-deoxy-manno-octulosonate cytidylyltransferase [Candidatus Polarisedimenticolia bacterium]|nr:3-deoxy-manno-octulosonate cytidylyltransferase [Candidatus Polarisedimenticolia bacterium]